jgi:hypothetical protein
MMKLCSSLLMAALALAAIVPLVYAEDVKDFAGKWMTTMPRSVTNRNQDLELTVTFDGKGKGFPKFVTPDGGVVFFAGAVTADLYQEDGKDRVVLLRVWDVTLSKDRKTMTWTQVKGTTKLEFKKQ